MIKAIIERFSRRLLFFLEKRDISGKIRKYIEAGRIPWSTGYSEYKYQAIADALADEKKVLAIGKGMVPVEYGLRLDERIVEYPWIAGNIRPGKATILDAGSTFNFHFILGQPFLAEKELTIITYAPEGKSYPENRISYIYSDLRTTPIKNQFFDIIVSQSTIEHIDMDNSIYGYDLAQSGRGQEKSYEYLKAIAEFLRILKPKGMLLLTFPFGRFENHGFFQQFDSEMLFRIRKLLKNKGTIKIQFFRYLPNGWIGCYEQDCKEIVSHNPHTGRGKGDDGAAHCRSICCIKFEKS